MNKLSCSGDIKRAAVAALLGVGAMILLICLLGLLVTCEVLTLQTGDSLAQAIVFVATFIVCVLSIRKGQKRKLMIAVVAAATSIVALLFLKMIVSGDTRLHYLRILLTFVIPIAACIVMGLPKRKRR